MQQNGSSENWLLRMKNMDAKNTWKIFEKGKHETPLDRIYRKSSLRNVLER